jgi:hypothetical protein
MSESETAMRPIQLIAVLILLPALVPPLRAGGIIPDRINQIIIQGKFEQPQPQFIVVFSAQPLQNDTGRLLTTASAAELQTLQSTPDRVVLRLYGKPQKNGRLDYFFGTLHDADQPWNNGRDFRWEDWEQHSADAWDHIAIALAPGTSPRIASVTGVTIRRGGKMLYDSRATKSYPNERRIEVALKPMLLRPANGRHPVLNLSDEMANFRTRYYELGDNPILQSAYADLGQTDKRKYARRGNNWCSEFSSFVYRSNDLLTPDPNKSDVHFVNMGEFFAKSGHVYPMREVMTWSDDDKRKKIKPGSFVSILIGDSTHSLFFTTWVEPERGQPITRYAALSGNNKGMVWAHDPLRLPTLEDLAGKTPEQLADYDRKVYFGVPGD